MSIKIRPMTDLAKKMDEIETLCIDQSIPVYITKKGSERLVVLGHEYYENLVRELDELKEQNELYASLIQAAGESRRGEGKDFNEFIDELESELRETIADDQQCASKVSS
jgi:PHD/YefM family antitoxin component YafN of YafNO toxin-antitoxin module